METCYSDAHAGCGGLGAGGGVQALMEELQDVTIDYIITMCCEAEVLCE